MSRQIVRLDPTLSKNEIECLSEDLYLYAYPLLVAYAFFHRQTQGPSAPERQQINRFTHFRTLSSPKLNNTIPWVNTDTLYSAVWLDLRREPFVLTVPAFEAHRFQDIQMNDWYTMGFITRGTRDVGNASRTYLITGPDWRGQAPSFVDEVVTAESWIVKLFARVVVESAEDVVAIHALQDKLDLRPLSQAIGGAPLPEAPLLDLPAPDPTLFNRAFFECATPAFIHYFNALMTLAAVHPTETTLFTHFARLGAVPGAPFDDAALTPDQCAAIQRGIEMGLGKINERLTRLDTPVNGWVFPLDLRGGRDVLGKGNDAYLRRAVIAKYAIWGPPAEEVVYMTAETDSKGERLDGAGREYTLRFDRPVPAKGFWSFTVYDAATRLLVEHPSGRYKRGDRDRDMIRAPDGSLTLYLQHDTPGTAREANWLPVPNKPFQVVARLYWPDPDVLARRYHPPPIVPAG